jgi:hypothetical protein
LGWGTGDADHLPGARSDLGSQGIVTLKTQLCTPFVHQPSLFSPCSRMLLVRVFGLSILKQPPTPRNLPILSRSWR